MKGKRFIHICAIRLGQDTEIDSFKHIDNNFKIKAKSSFMGKSIKTLIIFLVAHNFYNVSDVIRGVMITIITIIFLTITALLSLYLWITNVYLYWNKLGVPYIKPIFPYGNVYGVGKNVHIGGRLMEIYQNNKNKTPIFGIYTFIQARALILNLNVIKNILIKDFNYFTDRHVYYNEKDDPLSGHLFNLEGSRWKSLRSKLTPTFTSGKMKFMFPKVVEVGNNFVRALGEILKNSNDVDVKELFARYTTDVIGTCAFGIECNSLNDPNASFRLNGKKSISQPRQGRISRFILESFRETARFFKIKVEHDDVASFFINVVKETVDYRENNNIKQNDFMNLLINLKNTGKIDEKDTRKYEKISFKEMAAQAYVFFLAGFETASTTLSFCFYELALNPIIQINARNEIKNVLQKYNGLLTYESMMEMQYIHKIVDETLRKYPPVTVLTRKAAQNYKVPDTNFVIEKNITVAIPVYGIHHDPDIYQNPEAFDPERFQPDEIKKRHICSYMPFGEGPRNCIGIRFGKMQTYIGLISLLKDYKFTPSSLTKIPIKFSTNSLILSSEGTLFLKIEKY